METDDFDDYYNCDEDDNDNYDMTGCCEDAPSACSHCSNFGCGANPYS